MADENVKVNEGNETKETKEYTNDDIMIFLSALPKEEQEFLLNNNDFTSLKRCLDQEIYKNTLAVIDYKIEDLKFIRKSVTDLYLASNYTDTEANKVDRILKLYNTLDDDNKIKVNSKMQKEDNIDVAIGKLCDIWKEASEKFTDIIPKLETNR